MIEWKTDLEVLKDKLTTVEGLTGLKNRLTGDWLEFPKAVSKDLKILTEKVAGKPDLDLDPRCPDVPDNCTASSWRLPGGHEKRP